MIDTIRDLFKVVSGKKDVSVFITSQNPYEGGSNARTIRNNLNYFFLFKNLGDQQINRRLCQQLGLLRQFEIADKLNKRSAYGFTFLNLDVDSPDVRVSTDVLTWPIVIK